MYELIKDIKMLKGMNGKYQSDHDDIIIGWDNAIERCITLLESQDSILVSRKEIAGQVKKIKNNRFQKQSIFGCYAWLKGLE